MIYDYICPIDGSEHEVYKSYLDASRPEPCPVCQQPMQRQYNSIQVSVPNGDRVQAHKVMRQRGVEPVSMFEYGDVKSKVKPIELSHSEMSEIAARLD